MQLAWGRSARHVFVGWLCYVEACDQLCVQVVPVQGEDRGCELGSPFGFEHLDAEVLEGGLFGIVAIGDQ
ncbi:MAG: hypothetical protein ACM3II_10440 [Rhodospirillaceae bacterium]